VNGKQYVKIQQSLQKTTRCPTHAIYAACQFARGGRVLALDHNVAV
jgi:hypothetical protein